MVDTRKSSRGNGVNESSTVLKIGKAAAAIVTRKKSITESSSSPTREDSKSKDWLENFVGRPKLRPFVQPTNLPYNSNNNNANSVTSNTAKDGANLHNKPPVHIKRAAPTPMMQNNKRARVYSDGGRKNDYGRAERYATYTRLVKERKEVIKSKDTLKEKKLKLDADAAVLDKDAEEIDGQIEKMIQNASKEEIVEWLMKVSS